MSLLRWLHDLLHQPPVIPRSVPPRPTPGVKRTGRPAPVEFVPVIPAAPADMPPVGGMPDPFFIDRDTGEPVAATTPPGTPTFSIDSYGRVIELRPDGHWYRDGERMSDEQAAAYDAALGGPAREALDRHTVSVSDEIKEAARAMFIAACDPQDAAGRADAEACFTHWWWTGEVRPGGPVVTRDAHGVVIASRAGKVIGTLHTP